MALALKLTRENILTTYPRAIYRTATRAGTAAELADAGRYASHKHLLMADGRSLLAPEYEYILIWGFWNGPDEMLADADANHYRAISALHAYHTGLISQEQYLALMEDVKNRLLRVGVEDLNLRGSHLLLSVQSGTNTLITDSRGMPEVRICNCELLKNI
mgnify:CR=1 FL=1